MGREQVEPACDDGVLNEAANRLVRGRIAVAAGCAILGFAAALGLGDGLPEWLRIGRAAPLLVLAIVVALATLLFAIASHHLPAGGAGTRGLAIAALAAIDAVAFAAAAFASDGGVALMIALAPLIAGSVLLHALALARLAPWIARRPASLSAAGATTASSAPHPGGGASFGGKAREAAGIVRARAEALRLAAEEAGVADLLGHDLEVLVRQAEECQRALRELDPAPAVRGGGAARLAPPVVPEPEPWPSASTPPQS